VTTLAEAFVRLRPDNSTLGPEIERGLVPAATEAGKKAGRAAGEATGSSFKEGLKGLVTGFAGLEIFDFLKESVSAGREAAQSLRLTEAVIKSTGGAAGLTTDQVHELAEKLGELDGVQGDVVQSGENVLLTFTNIRNQSGAGNDIFDQATQSALDLSAAMHQDLQSSVVQLGKALNDPVKGLTALQRVGVTFSAQQKEQIKILTEHNDTLGAQKIILGEVQKEFGGAGAAATDPAQKAAVAWHDFQEQLGQKLLPALTQLLQTLLPFLPTVVAIVGAVADFIAHNHLLVEILGGVTIAVWLLNAALDANPISLIVIGLGLLVAAIVYCWQHFEGFRNVVKTVWKDVRQAGTDVADFFTKDIPHAFEATEQAAVARFTTVKNWVTGRVDDVIGAGRRVRDFFTVDIPHAWDTLVSATEAKFEAVRAKIAAKFDGAVQFVKDIPGRLVSLFVHIGDDFVHVGEAIVQGIIQGIGNLAGELLDKVKNMAGQALDGVKNFLGIGSPSRVFADEVGRQIPAGIAVGVREHTDLAVSSVGLLAAGIAAEPVPLGPAVQQPNDHGDLLAAMRRVGDLLATLKLTVGPEGVALAARAGEKTLSYAGR